MKLRTCKTVEEIKEDFAADSIFHKVWETEEIKILLDEFSLLQSERDALRMALEEIVKASYGPSYDIARQALEDNPK